MQKADSLEKTQRLGKTEGKRRRGRQRMRWLDSTTDSMEMNLSKLQKRAEDRKAWHAAVHGVTKSQTGLGDWTTTAWEPAKWRDHCSMWGMLSKAEYLQSLPTALESSVKGELVDISFMHIPAHAHTYALFRKYKRILYPWAQDVGRLCHVQ